MAEEWGLDLSLGAQAEEVRIHITYFRVVSKGMGLRLGRVGPTLEGLEFLLQGGALETEGMA